MTATERVELRHGCVAIYQLRSRCPLTGEWCDCDEAEAGWCPWPEEDPGSTAPAAKGVVRRGQHDAVAG